MYETITLKHLVTCFKSFEKCHRVSITFYPSDITQLNESSSVIS